MKLLNRVGLFLGMMACLSTGLYAAENNPMTKLTRGVTNIITSPMEMFTNYAKLQKAGENPMVCLLGGTVNGVLYTAGRIVGGVVETVTFPVPAPEGYKPLMNPPTPIEGYQEAPQVPPYL